MAFMWRHCNDPNQFVSLAVDTYAIYTGPDFTTDINTLRLEARLMLRFKVRACSEAHIILMDSTVNLLGDFCVWYIFFFVKRKVVRLIALLTLEVFGVAGLFISPYSSRLFRWRPGAPFIKMNNLWSQHVYVIMQWALWDETTYPFPNFNGPTVWISTLIPQFIMYAITYPQWD